MKQLQTWLLLIFTISSLRLSAQAPGDTVLSKSNLFIGLYAGLNNSFYAEGKNLKISKTKFNPGPSFLVFGEISLGKKWAVEIGLGEIFYPGKLLDGKDSFVTFDTSVVKKYTVTRLGYTTLPLMIKYKL